MSCWDLSLLKYLSLEICFCHESLATQNPSPGRACEKDVVKNQDTTSEVGKK